MNTVTFRSNSGISEPSLAFYIAICSNRSRAIQYLKSQLSRGRSESNLVPSKASVLARLDPSTSSDAICLLQEAVKSDDGEIRCTSISGAYQISANRKDFITEGDRQMEARLRAVVRNLAEAGFVESIAPDLRKATRSPMHSEDGLRKSFRLRSLGHRSRTLTQVRGGLRSYSINWSVGLPVSRVKVPRWLPYQKWKVGARFT
jgi:hypothetical protein